MSYYKDNHEDLQRTGETCRYVKSERQRKSFTNSIRAKFKQVRIVSQRLGRGYMITVEKIEERNPVVKGSKYAFHYDDILDKGFTHFETKHENEAISFRSSVLQRDFSVRSVKYQENDFWHVKVWLNDVRKTG